MRLSIVIPAYNEGRHLDAVVRRLHETIRANEPFTEIVIVNNGSADNTQQVAEGLAASLPDVRVVTVHKNEGYGHGILTGLIAANGEVLGWVHADDQTRPEDLVRIYQTMRERGYDACKAVRIQRHESRWRIIQSSLYNTLFRLMFRVPHRDINGTPKLLSRDLYNKLQLESKDWFIDPEMVLKAHQENARIGEVEMVWQTRGSGVSKVRLTTMMQFIRRMIRQRLGNK